MRRKLWINALLISPIAALYGVASFYVIHNASLKTCIFLFIFITGVALLLWSIHIYFALKHPTVNNFWRFIIACAVISGVRVVFQSFMPLDEVPIFVISNQYMLYGVFVSLLPNIIIMILCNSIVNGYKKAAAEREVQELRFQNSEAQKQVLTQQLQPHFLFNALSVLKSLISTNQQKAEEYILRLSHFLQYSIHSHREEVVDLERELEFVTDYVALQKVRFGNAFVSSIDIPIEVYKQRIPVFALQTLVENIFKHNHFTERRPLEFSIKYSSDTLIVSNKRNPAIHVAQNHTGLTNLNSRYLLITNKEIEVIATVEEFIVVIPIIK